MVGLNANEILKVENWLIGYWNHLPLVGSYASYDYLSIYLRSDQIK